MRQLDGKVALVTGGARGIGAGIVERFAADGADVIFTYAAAKGPADELVARVRAAGDNAEAVRAESGDSAQTEAVIADLHSKHGRLDVVVSNAGGGTIKPLADLSSAEVDRMIDVNIRGTVDVVRHALPYQSAGGRIITIGSASARYIPDDASSIYAMTKGAVASFVRGMARELGPRGITINNVEPGPVHTEANPEDGPAADWLRSRIAIGRFGKVTEVASLVTYLASKETDLIAGASIAIDGGYSA